MKRIKRIIRSFIRIINRTELKILPGQLAFSFTTILIPLLALFGLIAGKIINNFDLINYLSNTLPKGISPLLTSLVINNASADIFIFIVSIVVFGSGGYAAVIYASNMFYGVDNQSFWKTRAKAIFMLFITLFLLMFIVLIPIFGEAIMNLILDLLSVSRSNIVYIEKIYGILSIPLTFLIIFACVDFMYIFAPNEKLPNKTTALGSLFVTAGWMIITKGYSIYITSMANYDQIYSNVSNIVMLLIWIWALSYVFVIGMAINFNKYKKSKE